MANARLHPPLLASSQVETFGIAFLPWVLSGASLHTFEYTHHLGMCAGGSETAFGCVCYPPGSL